MFIIKQFYFKNIFKIKFFLSLVSSCNKSKIINKKVF